MLKESEDGRDLSGAHLFKLSPDGRLVAVIPHNGSKVEIWEVASGKKRGELGGHKGRVADAAFSPDGSQLAVSSEDTTILIWDLKRPLQLAKLKDRLTDDEIATDMKALYQADAVKAEAAIWRLIHAGKDSVPYLAKHLRPVAAPDPKVVARLLADLDSGDYRIRTKAQIDLEALGERILGDIDAALRQTNPLERKRRLTELHQKAQKAAEPFSTADRIAEWRMLEVLEKVGAPAAIQQLRDLAGGTPSAQLTIAAQGILTRLGKTRSE